MKNISKFLLFFLFFFVALWGTRLKGINIGILELFPLRIIAIVWIFAFIGSNNIRASLQFFGIKKSFQYLEVLFFYAAFSVVWAVDKSACTTGLLVLATSIVTTFMVASMINSEEDLSMMSAAVILNLLIVFLIAIYESFTSHFIFPVTDGKENYEYTYNMFGLFRPKVMFININNLSAFIGMSIAPCLIYFRDKKTRFVLSTIFFLLAAVVMILTDSRTGFVCILFSILFIWLFNYRSTKSIFKILFFFLGIFLLFLFITYYEFIESIIFVQGGVGGEDRLPIWRDCINTCVNNLFMGGGWANAPALSRTNIPPHNYLLQILVEVGIIGLFSLLLFLNKIFPRYGILKTNQMYEYSFLFIILFIISSVGPSSLHGCYYLWFYFGIFLAIKQKLVVN